jgi:hypothetical protein
MTLSSEISLFSDVLIPKRRVLLDEILHNLNTFWVIEYSNIDSSTTEMLLRSLKSGVLSNNDTWYPIQQNSSAAHVTG